MDYFIFVVYSKNVFLNLVVKDVKMYIGYFIKQVVIIWEGKGYNVNFKLVLEKVFIMVLIIQLVMNRILFFGFYQCVILLLY